MKRVGIVCEFNPFTEGHAYLLDEVRRAGAETVVCLMSGLFVQRGEPAIMPPYYRAKAAVASGADAVFMLPFPASSAGAGYFAEAAVKILSELGCDTIAFGSECGDTEELCRKADIFSAAFPDVKSAGLSDHSATGIAESFFSSGNESPNDILAINYILAVRRLAPRIGLFTVKRLGDGYREASSGIPGGPLPSASGVRRLLCDRPPEAVPGLPEGSADSIKEAVNDGCFPVVPEKAGPFLHASWRLSENGENLAECGGGLWSFLHRAALSSEDYTAFRRLASTKRYTTSRINRAVLFGALGVKASELDSPPAYVRLLAADSEGRRIAAEARNKGGISIVTRVSDIPDTPEAVAQYRLESRSAALYSLLLPRPLPADALLKNPPHIDFSDGKIGKKE
ncbi:MAG: nucleotidyltransferase family protein [Clostridia bacterium]|nr:nucleotidyltransferase family protein [Clostridia bacterium]